VGNKIETLNPQIDLLSFLKMNPENEKSSSSLLPSIRFDHGREGQRESWRWIIMVELRPKILFQVC